MIFGLTGKLSIDIFSACGVHIVYCSTLCVFYVFRVLLVILITVVGVALLGLNNGYIHMPPLTLKLSQIYEKQVARGLPLKVIA